MEKLLVTMLCIIVAFMQSCIHNKRTKHDGDLNEHGNGIEEVFFDDPYYIRANEVRDTSFTLPRKLLDDPLAFMKALTNVQMINREWTDKYDYTEKLLFGDSILGKICKEVADGKGTPVFLTDDICNEEFFSYDLDVRKG